MSNQKWSIRSSLRSDDANREPEAPVNTAAVTILRLNAVRVYQTNLVVEAR